MADQIEQLSKREQLAASIMQGVITANAGKQVNSHDMAQAAVKHADALIKALNTNNQP